MFSEIPLAEMQHKAMLLIKKIALHILHPGTITATITGNVSLFVSLCCMKALL